MQGARSSGVSSRHQVLGPYLQKRTGGTKNRRSTATNSEGKDERFLPKILANLGNGGWGQVGEGSSRPEQTSSAKTRAVTH